MKPLIVLIVSFLIALLGIFLFTGQFDLALSARISMSVMLIFTAIGHFAFTEGMQLMIPDFIPLKKWIVWVTGVLEIIFALLLLVPSANPLTAWLLILFFVCILPANIYAAMNHVDYQKATLEGKGVKYLWFRIPFQILLIIWVYFSCIVFY